MKLHTKFNKIGYSFVFFECCFNFKTPIYQSYKAYPFINRSAISINLISVIICSHSTHNLISAQMLCYFNVYAES